MTRKLVIGDVFPELAIDLVDGTRMALPSGLGGNYRVVLFYRGHW